MFREILEANGGEELRKLTESLLSFAQSGDSRAAQLILERAYCKPAMAVEDRDAILATGAGVDPLLALYGVPTH